MRTKVGVLMLTAFVPAICSWAQGDAIPRAKDLIVDGAPTVGVKLHASVLTTGVASPDGKGKCVRVGMPVTEEWPGISMTFDAPQDWSEFTALKFDLILESPNPIRLNLRIDRVGSTDDDYTSRFNVGGVQDLAFNPGANTLRISIERMVNGHINNPGLDVTKITKVVLFSGKLQQEASLVVKRVWLEKAAPADDVCRLWDSRRQELPAAAWTFPGDLMTVAGVAQPGGMMLRVKAQPTGGRGGYAVMEARTLARDWQGYDRLVLSCSNPGKDPLTLGINILDAMGKEVMYRFKARPGTTEIELPLAAAEIIDLEHILSVKLLVAAKGEEFRFWLEHLYLKRTEGRRVVVVDTPGETPKPGDWVIDLTKFYDSRGDRRLADIVIPYDGPEKQLVVKCRPATTKSFRLILPAELASKCRKAECRATGFYINHGEMLIYFADATPVEEGGATVLRPIKGLGF